MSRHFIVVVILMAGLMGCVQPRPDSSQLQPCPPTASPRVHESDGVGIQACHNCQCKYGDCARQQRHSTQS